MSILPRAGDEPAALSGEILRTPKLMQVRA